MPAASCRRNSSNLRLLFERALAGVCDGINGSAAPLLPRILDPFGGDIFQNGVAAQPFRDLLTNPCGTRR